MILMVCLGVIGFLVWIMLCRVMLLMYFMMM